MSDQYDLVMAKMRMAERMVFAVRGRREAGSDPDRDLEEILRLFTRAFNGITAATEAAVYVPPEPGPEDIARP